MLVKALTSFAPPGQPSVSEGDVVEMPDGADWLTCGLCAPYEGDAPAVRKLDHSAKKATKKKAKK